jgi:hypothetical protein
MISGYNGGGVHPGDSIYLYVYYTYSNGTTSDDIATISGWVASSYEDYFILENKNKFTVKNDATSGNPYIKYHLDGYDDATFPISVETSS